MTDLERALLELEIDWPATPDLAAAVRARVVAEPAQPSSAGRLRGRGAAWRPRMRGLRGRGAAWRPRMRGLRGRGAAARPRMRGLRGRGAGRSLRARVAWVAAALAVLAGGTLAVSPAARSDVLRWLGLESVEIRREPPRATPGPPSRLGETLNLGAAVTLAEASRLTGRPAIAPKSLGTPDAVWIGGAAGDSVRPVSLVYAPRAGVLAPSRVTGVALLVQTFGPHTELMIEKMVGMESELERLTVAGHDAYWIGGEPHGFAYSSPGGGAFEPQRLADHTLLVDVGGSLLRIEGGVTRAQAVAIAEDALGG